MVFVAGQILTAAQLNSEILSPFPLGIGAWTSYTPSFTQGGTVTKTVEYAAYTRIGDLVLAHFSLAPTGAGTAAQPIRVGLPPYVPIPYRLLGGTVDVFDASASVWYIGAAAYATTTTVAGQASGVGSVLGQAGMAAALAVGDVVAGSIWYYTSS